ncbi:MAG TPA: hypothetical protein DDW23_00795 [Planctomycetes bacterium]|nr:hypothetical protein [Planctomycetota bacterium]
MAFRAPSYIRLAEARTKHPSWWAIWRITFIRGWKSTWVRRLTIGAIAQGVAITLVMYFIQTVLPGWRTILRDLGQLAGQDGGMSVNEFDSRFYLVALQWFVYPFLLPIGALLGHTLITGDLKSNALEAYFSRPITPGAYLIGRTGAFTAFLLLVTLAPLLWIWLFDVLTAPDGHFEKVAMVPLGMSAAMGLLALTVALFVQAVSSFTRNGTKTALFLVTFIVLSGSLGPIFSKITGEVSYLAIAFYQDIFTLANGLLDWPFDADESPPFQLALGVILAILLSSLSALIFQIRTKGRVG